MNRIQILFIFLLGCNTFEYSPNQIFDGDAPRDLNKINLGRLESNALDDDTVTIAFVGDSQRFYDDVEDFVGKVNALQSVDFILLAGDITDFGLLREYEWIQHEFSRLNAPYLAVVGNHDVVGNGEDVFRRMFGPLNYSFIYDSIKFVVHNTNSREYVSQSVPDLEWLANEMVNESATPVKYFVPVSHVPPMNEDFNSSLVEPYTKLFASTPGLLVSLHGHVHEHTDAYPYQDGIRYITSFAFNQRSFVLLKIVNGKIEKELIEY